MTDQNKAALEDQELADELTALYARGFKLTKWATKALVAAGVVASLGLVWLLLSHFALPVTELKEMDIPTALLNSFSDVVVQSGGGGSGGLDDISSQVEGIQSMLFGWAIGPVMSVVGMLLLIAGGACMIFGIEGATPRILAMFGFLIMAPNTLNYIGGGGMGGEDKTYQSDRAEFVESVERHNLSDVAHKLNAKAGLEADYVRAQVAMLEKSSDPKLYQNVASRLDEKPGFTPNEKVAYLIDLAAFNQVKGEIAREYLSDTVSTAQNRQATAKVHFSLAAILLVAGAALLMFARSLIRRVHRIDGKMAEKLKRQNKPDHDKDEPKTA